MPEIIMRRKVKKRRARWPFGLIVIIVLVALAINYIRPLPAVHADPQTIATIEAKSVDLNWPTTGQAAVGAVGYGLLAEHDDDTPLATASIAKVITALCVLQKYPLSAGQTGPEIMLSDQDVQLYDNYLSQQGSVAAVQAGEQISEYQLLEGMLLPSANNMADSLATWAFGSLQAYATYANQFLAMNGLSHTHVGSDASGFNPSTTSTAGDLVKLGILAAQQPAIAKIATENQTDLPVAGTVYNYNTLLGQDGVNGLKTGNNDQDTGAFLLTATANIGGKNITVVAAVMGQPSRYDALTASAQLNTSLQAGFASKVIASKGQTVSSYTTPWGTTGHIVASRGLQAVYWRPAGGKIVEKLSGFKGDQSSTEAGQLDFRSGNTEVATPLAVREPAAGPSLWWRLTRL